MTLTTKEDKPPLFEDPSTEKVVTFFRDFMNNNQITSWTGTQGSGKSNLFTMFREDAK